MPWVCRNCNEAVDVEVEIFTRGSYCMRYNSDDANLRRGNLTDHDYEDDTETNTRCQNCESEEVIWLTDTEWEEEQEETEEETPLIYTGGITSNEVPIGYAANDAAVGEPLYVVETPLSKTVTIPTEKEKEELKIEGKRNAYNNICGSK
jgi:hypothetical protein